MGLQVYWSRPQILPTIGEGLVTFGQLLNVDCFLGRILHPPITFQKTQSVSATPEILGYFSTMTQHFFGTGVVKQGWGGYGGWHVLKVTHSMLPNVKFEWNNVQASHKNRLFSIPFSH